MEHRGTPRHRVFGVSPNTLILLTGIATLALGVLVFVLSP